MTRRSTSLAIKLLVSFGILAAFSAFVDGQRLVRLIREVHLGYLVLLLALALGRMGIAASRLQLIIAGRVGIGLGELTRQYFIGAYFNNLLPTSIGGDAARIVLLSRSGLPKSEGAVYVATERILGAAALVLLAVLGTFIFSVTSEIQLAVFGLVVVSAIVALFCLVFQRKLDAIASADSVFGSAARAALDILDRPTQLLLGLIVSLAFQLASITLSYVMALALGIELSFPACVALVPLVWLVTLLPVSIGGIGLREASFAMLLGTAGISTEESLLISLGTYAALLFSGAVGGLLLVRGDTAQFLTGSEGRRA